MELALSLWDDGSFQAQCSEGLATLQSFSLSVREMRSEDARAFLEVHHKAVRELAADSYPSDVIEAWAPLPITEKHVQFVCSNADQEFRLVAELNGEIIWHWLPHASK
jgi:hypothetical protein